MKEIAVKSSASLSSHAPHIFTFLVLAFSSLAFLIWSLAQSSSLCISMEIFLWGKENTLRTLSYSHPAPSLPPPPTLDPNLACVCVHVCVCVCLGLSTPTSNSQTPGEYPRIQLNSDTIHWKIESDSASKGLNLTRPPSASGANLQSSYYSVSGLLAIHGSSSDSFQLRRPITSLLLINWL